jgi:hypothetical protein
MIQLLRFVPALIRWLRRSPAECEAEIAYLRQQLIILKRTALTGSRLKAADRLIFVFFYRLFPSLLDASGRGKVFLGMDGKPRESAMRNIGNPFQQPGTMRAEPPLSP